MRVTRRESKREEKRTGSGSIRRTCERDRKTEGDRGSGGVVEVRGDEKTQERGYTGAREARGMEAQERRRGTKHRAFPGSSIGNLTNADIRIHLRTKMLKPANF